MELEFHDGMSKLFKEDPEAFEKKRQELIEETITNAPPHIQLKLRAMQAKWDKTMKYAGLEENRLAFAKNILMDKFLDDFKPAVQKLVEIFKKR